MRAIETLHLEPKGKWQLKAEVHFDAGYSPNDFDGLTQKQIDAWENDEWHYVSLRIRASLEGIQLGEYWLGGIEYGEFPNTNDNDELLGYSAITLETIMADDYGYSEDCIAEAISRAEETLERLVEKAKDYAKAVA